MQEYEATARPRAPLPRVRTCFLRARCRRQVLLPTPCRRAWRVATSTCRCGGEDLVDGDRARTSCTTCMGAQPLRGLPKKGVSFRAAARTLLNVKNFPLTRSMISTWRTRTPSGGGAYSTRSISTAARVRAPADDARGAGGTMRTRFCVSDSYKDSTQSGFLIWTKL